MKRIHRDLFGETLWITVTNVHIIILNLPVIFG